MQVFKLCFLFVFFSLPLFPSEKCVSHFNEYLPYLRKLTPNQHIDLNGNWPQEIKNFFSYQSGELKLIASPVYSWRSAQEQVHIKRYSHMNDLRRDRRGLQVFSELTQEDDPVKIIKEIKSSHQTLVFYEPLKGLTLDGVIRSGVFPENLAIKFQKIYSEYLFNIHKRAKEKYGPENVELFYNSNVNYQSYRKTDVIVPSFRMQINHPTLGDNITLIPHTGNVLVDLDGGKMTLIDPQ